jgi:hypothetical protein
MIGDTVGLDRPSTQLDDAGQRVGVEGHLDGPGAENGGLPLREPLGARWGRSGAVATQAVARACSLALALSVMPGKRRRNPPLFVSSHSGLKSSGSRPDLEHLATIFSAAAIASRQLSLMPEPIRTSPSA